MTSPPDSNAGTVRSSLERLFLEAADLAPDEQRAFVRIQCGKDPELGAALQSLLDGDLKSSRMPLPADLENLRFGPYRATGQIGEGGMGVVYRCTRDDREYQKDVAVKLIRRGMHTEGTLARFRNERQILAGLDHPNIARLLDGGNEGGSPYLVMEYVEGEKLSDYLERQQPSLAARLGLFRRICSAVHYAHQRMVIHRDLKPGNILVMADGTPKLLDFGIAKVLEDEGDLDATTIPAARMLTPSYASPEQIRGEQVTTASDVYSLGVILYEMLTGRSPYRQGKGATAEFLRDVCEQEPERPSADGRRELEGDLDNIVLMALKKDPTRRYASVDQLSGDIKQYLNGMPVLARGDSFGYVAGKFVRRNRVIVFAAVLVLLIASASVLAIVRSAAEAKRQRGKAEVRFNDLRDFAHSVIFDVDAALDEIPGALPARVLINKKAEAYLDRLSAEAPADLALRRELATSYNQLARVEGVPGHGNLGNAAAARASLNKALDVLRGSLAIDPSSALDHGLLIAIYNSLGQLEWGTGDPAAALAAHEQGLKEVQALVGRIPHPPDRLLAAAGSAYLFVALDKGANFWNLGDPVSTLPLLQRSLDLFGQMKSPKEAEQARNLANVERVFSLVLYQLGQPAAADDHYRRAIGYLKLNDPGSQSVLLAAQVWHAHALLDQNDISTALPLSASALDLAEQLVHADPRNFLGLLYRHHAEFVFGRALVLSGNTGSGMERIHHAMDAEEEMLARDPEFAYISAFLTLHSILAGNLNLSLNRGEEARKHFERAIQLSQAQSAAHPSDAQALCNLAEAEHGMEKYLARQGDSAGAAVHAAKAHTAARRVLAAHPDHARAQTLL